MRKLLSRTCVVNLFAVASFLTVLCVFFDSLPAQTKKPRSGQRRLVDGKSIETGNPEPEEDPELIQFGIYHETAPRAKATSPRPTTLPLKLNPDDRIALIGNSLLEGTQNYGNLEALLHQKFPEHKLIVRNLAWSADTPDLQPRPENFADLDQHLTHEEVDVIFAAYGFNESFAGDEGLEDFRDSLTKHIQHLQSHAFNGESGPQIVLVSPIACENIENVPAADMNNKNLAKYRDVIEKVATDLQVAFVDVFVETAETFQKDETNWTVNGVHLNDHGDELFARTLYRELFGEEASAIDANLRDVIIDKDRQYFRRYRPANTFYYTGDRNKSYGYLDFLPAMRNFDMMVANREGRIWDLAQGKEVEDAIDDSNIPPLPKTKESRGANEWMSAADELASFEIDPRFDVTLFAGEEQFPELGAPIQMRWDNRGRLWVSCSTTYPHVYPGNEPDDKIVILEDTDQDGRADKSTVFADDLHIPLSFEFGDGGVYVSEMPHLTFLEDLDGDDKADRRTQLLTGFGTEDSHHALHDFTWTPDGDLLFRESIFHHSQVETPYGPIRQQNSGWFRYVPKYQRLTSFGTYHSTNPWGVTFDDWGNHVASHPIFAAAFHSLDPAYPNQHPKPAGLQAYSGTCGHEFVDFASFPEELQGGFLKARYKPTNRLEIHKWNETPFGFEEEYVSDLIFSRNLSFIPVDLRYGPRGAMYLCDWYNPVKGHAQYSLRDERRDRHSGRIWRITAKGYPLSDAPKIAEASVEELLDNLKRPEYRIRYWSKRELRERDLNEVLPALNAWVDRLDSSDPRYRHHQMEAVWTYRWIDERNKNLLRDLLACDDHHARAAATQQLRYWHTSLPDSIELLKKSANDPNGLVRMEAAIAATYIGTERAFEALLEVVQHPAQSHLAYAIQSAIGSAPMVRHWEDRPELKVDSILARLRRSSQLKEPTPSASEKQFDLQDDLLTVRISCLPERMRYSVTEITALVGQPVKIVFSNPDATDHNLVIVKPGALEEVGMAANEMAKDPKNANSDFLPSDKKDLILHASPMIGPTRKTQVDVLRFNAPATPGIYPFVCTFPGHWVIMKGDLIVANDLKEAERLLAEREPTFVQEWVMEDFANLQVADDDETIMRGMQSFAKAKCTQCHQMHGHGVNLGPDLTKVHERFKGMKLLEQILAPSSDIHKEFRNVQFLLTNGRILTGVVVKETDAEYHIASNLLIPDQVTRVPKQQIEEQHFSTISPMPAGLANVLEKQEIVDLVSFLQAGGYHPPEHLKHHHSTKE
ncbi:PVC-type heme-binding CxxCH protein [Thalassoglobus sp. JC818]|uniref:PVC-type heme-binding CxxCH protein n=1 Tax=Thalassoglobus sp. JC818 TaxID=3232136 RepID=UPI003458BC1E